MDNYESLNRFMKLPIRPCFNCFTWDGAVYKKRCCRTNFSQSAALERQNGGFIGELLSM